MWRLKVWMGDPLTSKPVHVWWLTTGNAAECNRRMFANAGHYSAVRVDFDPARAV